MRFAKQLMIFLLVLSLCSCAGSASETIYSEAENLTPLTGRILFDEDDYESTCNEDSAYGITLTGQTAESSSAYVEISGNTITITKGGTYIVSGELEGMLIVHASKEDTVHIVLSNASISNPSCAALYVRKAGKVVITSAEGTANHLSNGGEYIDIDDNNIDSVIFSKDDLAINGSGELNIEASAGHGIVSKDSLRITHANIHISSASHAISAKDDIGIDGGHYTLQSGKDGIHGEDKDDASLGNVLLLGGEFDITSEGDCISAENALRIDGGNYSLVSGGGYGNAVSRKDDFIRFRGDTDIAEEDSVSSKAIKSSGNTYIGAGEFNIDASDDALHSDSDLFVSAGSFNILTGDDALHAENSLHIYGGEINVSSCYEGLEAHTVDVYDGKISLVSSDDGMNAAGGSDGSGMSSDFRTDDPFASDPDAYIHIHGGEIYIRNGGDGIDSNGEIRISGGKTAITGPVNGGNGSLDYGTEAYIEGGIFFAAGSAQMAEHFSENSTQCALMLSSDGKEGSLIRVDDASGSRIFESTAGCDFQCILMSMPEFELGKTYTVSIAENTTEIHFDSTLFSDVTAFGFDGRMNRGSQMPPQGNPPAFPGNKQRPGSGFMPPEGMQKPEGISFPDDFKP